MTNYSYKFTVVTATYNSVKYLHRVWESLKSQTFDDFEWIIIDDGSTDGTGELIESWKKEEHFFPIKHFYQPNQGKLVAINKAVQHSSGELYLNVDADDRIKPNCLQTLFNVWDSIPAKDRASLKGVVALCEDQKVRVFSQMQAL